MEVIYEDLFKRVEVLEWSDLYIDGVRMPKHKRTIYFNSDYKPNFGNKDLSCADRIFINENLQSLRSTKDK